MHITTPLESIEYAFTQRGIEPPSTDSRLEYDAETHVTRQEEANRFGRSTSGCERVPNSFAMDPA
jgi:hypothetical protein